MIYTFGFFYNMFVLFGTVLSSCLLYFLILDFWISRDYVAFEALELYDAIFIHDADLVYYSLLLSCWKLDLYEDHLYHDKVLALN